MTARDEIVCPEDWEWTTDWTVDLNRAVDEDGYILFCLLFYSVLRLAVNVLFLLFLPSCRLLRG